jgi:hypothetical protein
MKADKIIDILSRMPGRRMLFLVVIVTIICVSGCTSGKYNSRSDWHRTPASTGKNKCGCLLNRSGNNTFRLYYNTQYVFQA